MLLRDETSSVELQPLGYQFAAAGDNEFDDNWLIIDVAVTTPEGSWSVADPCLLTDEARQVSVWLRAVAAETVAVTGPDAEGLLWPDTLFIEPVLGFSLADQGDGAALVRVHLSIEAVPPWLQGDGRPRLYQYVVEVRLGTAALLHAADEWDLALESFPSR